MRRPLTCGAKQVIRSDAAKFRPAGMTDLKSEAEISRFLQKKFGNHGKTWVSDLNLYLVAVLMPLAIWAHFGGRAGLF